MNPVATQTSPRCPLSQMPASERGSVVSLAGERSFVSRLAALGFVPGASINMVQNYGKGPLIVLIRQTRVALGRVEAANVVVQREG